jgi:Mor family transcriptional regulator
MSGRPSLALDHAAIQRDRQRGQSLGQLAKGYRVSRTTISRVVGQTTRSSQQASTWPVPKGLGKTPTLTS